MSHAFPNQGLPGGSEGDPVHLGLPGRQPDPVEGCAVCALIDEDRRLAHQAADHSAVADANGKLRNHAYHCSQETLWR